MRHPDCSGASTGLTLVMWGEHSAYRGVELSERGVTISIDFISLTKLLRAGIVNE